MAVLEKILANQGAKIIGDVVGSAASHFLNRSDSDVVNEYNTPQNQMARMTAAGISPAAAAAGISGSPNLGQQAQASSNLSSGNLSPLTDYIELKNLKLAEDKNAAEVELIKSQTKKNMVESENISTMQPYNIQEIQSRLGLNKQQAENLAAVANRVNSLLPFEKRQFSATIQHLRAQCAELKAQWRYLNQQTRRERIENIYRSWRSDIIRKYGFDPEMDLENIVFINSIEGVDELQQTLDSFYDGILSPSPIEPRPGDPRYGNSPVHSDSLIDYLGDDEPWLKDSFK